MHSKWILSEHVSQIVLACTLTTFLVSEAVVIVASLGFLNGHASLGISRHLLVNVFLTSIPGIAGIRGYYVVRRLRSKLDAEREEATLVWFSRQFLAAAVFAYAAIISVVASLK